MNSNFYNKIHNSNQNMFYGRYIKHTDREHIQDDLYYIYKNDFGSLYSGDFKGKGRGGYISNIICAGGYFEEVTEEEYKLLEFKYKNPNINIYEIY